MIQKIPSNYNCNVKKFNPNANHERENITIGDQNLPWETEEKPASKSSLFTDKE